MLDPTHADDSALRAAASQPLIRRRHPLQWIATIVIAVIAVQAVVLLAANPAFQWDVVPPGQREAAKAIGLGAPRAFVRIILPQALRAMLPPMGSMLIGILKATSLVSTIAIADLMSAVSAIYNRTFEVVPLLVVATAWYLVLTSALSALQWYIERRVGRGFVRRGTRTVRTPKIRVPEGAL